MNALRLRVDRVLGWILGGILGLAVAGVLWQIFTRYVLNDPSRYTGELVRYLLIWIGMLGASHAMGRRSHLAVDLLNQSLEGRARHVAAMSVQVLIAAFALGVLGVGGGRLVSLTLALDQRSAALGVPMGWVYLVIPLSGGLIAFYALCFLLEHRDLMRRGAGTETG